MKKIKSLLCSVAVACASFAVLVPASPAHGCTGDPCDSFCDSIRDLNQKLPPKLKLTDCQLR